MECLKFAKGEECEWEGMSLQKNKADGVTVSEVRQTGSVPLAQQGPLCLRLECLLVCGTNAA